MFAPSPVPRLFALPPGADFACEVARGLADRLAGAPPEDWARVTIFVNTARMRRRLTQAFDAGPARLLPRIRLVTDLAFDPIEGDPRPPAPPLRRRLELAQLIGALLDRQPDVAPRAALYDLSDSLARLIDEMHGEGVGLDAIRGLDVGDASGHWQRTLAFLQIVGDWIDPETAAPAAELRQRRVVEALAEKWIADPPQGPVIVAGSTGSRGATALFIEAVARLPQGATILPGFDFDTPEEVWRGLDEAKTGEDHPQFRYARMMHRLGLTAGEVQAWTDAPPPRPARNRLVSLSLRPAPVTDQWMRDGPTLGPMDAATEGLTLVEAESPRAEAEAIALRLRQAVEDGQRAILVTPDRMLTRRVEAALDRWDIVPDDSAGTPLPLTAPGRLLRQVAELLGTRLTADALLALLKHPLAATGAKRGDHLRWARELELRFRKDGAPFPTRADLAAWAALRKEDDGRAAWAAWVADLLEPLADPAPRPLAEHLARHRAAAEGLAAGLNGSGSGGLWDERPGREALARVTEFERHADVGGTVSTFDYRTLFDGVLRGGEVRDRDEGHPLVLFRGTLEARIETAPLVILGGLNDGIWPPVPAPDPWLNRALRQEAGLLLPERQIGLSAHDYQQAIAADEVWLTRSVRSAEAETVPGRWLNRLTNLVAGLPDQGGPAALEAMRDRGRLWLARAAAGDAPAERTAPAKRPSPRIPAEARPATYTASDIATLIRDPYALYARKVLGLYRLDPLRQVPDAAQRGTVLHTALERFVKEGPPPTDPDARRRLMATVAEVLEAECPWPTVRHVWAGRFERVADWFLETEAERRAKGTPALFEEKGEVPIAGLGVTVTAKADRIDDDGAGGALIYDYKTGKAPSQKRQATFDKQLMIEAAILDRGGFPRMQGHRTREAAYIGLGADPKVEPAPLSPETWDRLVELLASWRSPDRGYTSRIAPAFISYDGDYDQLARRGEWDDTDDPAPETLT
ncbi:double-strand break repair protein AddB [Wenxinia marina]|uniref:Double-strand break repair protein AddB, alphaproteobacterial type n=1 Tax=Wenxinia marina DSM 24838 TaxID=1123501 RepID=A0A0D0NS70_9RHOB|nr:double-strand break repair protein AddB [Wenxinia marina]KIQ71080.1 double-strand break repair protein AddB, alphaproteobacterial type [Wenxinia marina DSM 24838]GGL55020.1 double-strand break repair protein AddB [Wenxinia marina]